MNRTRQTLVATLVSGFLFLVPASVAAQKPFAYPARGQSSEQQARDDGECAAWARQSTGIDPMAAAAASPPAETGPQGERLRGAARGAAGGAVIGAIAGDAGKGAGIGAVAGTMAGGRQSRQNQKAAGQQAQSQQAQTLNTYYRAYGACMEGHGYTIK